MSSQPNEIVIKNRLYGKGRGWVFTPSDFDDLTSEESTWSVLSKLVAENTIRRLKQGIYDYPRQHPNLGALPPEINKVADAVARKLNLTIQPSGAFAANLLGLSEQVPGKATFITDGADQAIKIPGLIIYFKKTTPKRMKTAGSISGLVFEALKFLTREHITKEIINKLRKQLNSEDKKRLLLDAHLAPAWMAKIIKNDVCND